MSKARARKFTYFDVHTHLSSRFVANWPLVGERALDAGVGFVNVAVDLESAREAIRQAEYFGQNGFCAVGLHPTEGQLVDLTEIAALANHPQVVAIGECGLDYFHQAETGERVRQQELFRKHLDLALSLQKPLMIHCRPSAKTFDAYNDLFEILEEYYKAGEIPIFNLHFFVGDWLLAQRFLSLGGYLSFSGVITFSNQYDEIIKNMPLERLLSETDAPFAAPVPFRGKCNEPTYVCYVAQKIAALRSEPDSLVLAMLVENAKKFFKLDNL